MIPNFATQRDRKCVIAREIAVRRPPDHPRRITLESAVPPRTQRNSWGKRGKELTNILPTNIEPRIPLQIPLTNPWDLERRFVVNSELEGV